MAGPGAPAPADIVVVGLGPADDELLPPASVAAMTAAARCFVRTERHPAARAALARVRAAGGTVTSFDDVYEAAPDFDTVYRTIADRLVEAAAEVGEAAGAGAGTPTVCLAVPGSPLVAERVVDLLRARDDVVVRIVPALSFLDLAWDRLAVDPVDSGVRIVDAATFAVAAAGQPGPFLVAQCHRRELLSEVKLAVAEGLEPAGAEPPPAVLLHHLGLPDEQVRRVPWADVDRVLEPDHLTALWVAASPVVASEAARLQELVRVLRQRCPWDRRQTHGSLAPHLLEEAYEALDAITAADRAGPDAPAPVVEHLMEELGDVAFQVFFHAHLAAESGWFTVTDVFRAVHDKLVFRHPHVFGDAEVHTAEEVAGRWELLKQQEKGRASVFDGIPSALPALAMTAKVQRRAEGLADRPEAGADRATALVAALAARALGGTVPTPGGAAPAGDRDDAALVGEALFAVVDLARRAGVDPETALRAVTDGFRRHLERER